MMELVNEARLDQFTRTHRDARPWLANWATVVRDAEWHSLKDVRAAYPSADGVKLRSGFVVTVFNVKGNEYRLLSHIDYSLQRVTVLSVMTHEEYDRDAWKG